MSATTSFASFDDFIGRLIKAVHEAEDAGRSVDIKVVLETAPTPSSQDDAKVERRHLVYNSDPEIDAVAPSAHAACGLEDCDGGCR